uniref:Uncharacterized protein n=1 Tax=Noccaea caerulescens TaxID=107243 RepID=A0A1J3EWU8_NOCCA
MISGHFCMELADCAIEGDIAVLLVHVVVASSGLIPKDNAEGFDMSGLALEDLIDCKDLSLGRLGLQLAPQMIPKLRLGDHFISGEETDGVDLGIGLLLGG